MAGGLREGGILGIKLLKRPKYRSNNFIPKAPPAAPQMFVSAIQISKCDRQKIP